PGVLHGMIYSLPGEYNNICTGTYVFIYYHLNTTLLANDTEKRRGWQHLAPARGATPMKRLRRTMQSSHGSDRACPCHAQWHESFHSPTKSIHRSLTRKEKTNGKAVYTPRPDKRRHA